MKKSLKARYVVYVPGAEAETTSTTRTRGQADKVMALFRSWKTPNGEAVRPRLLSPGSKLPTSVVFSLP